MEKIRHLKRNEIDDAKWNKVIETSIQSRIYACSVWLDYLSPKWEALVHGNYESVMPLPVKKKYGFRYLSQPPFTQQLGIFSKNEMNENTVKAFYSKAKELFSFAAICVKNQYADCDFLFTERKNYIVDLSFSYDSIRGNYSGNLIKKSLNYIDKTSLRYLKENDISSALQLSQTLYRSKMTITSSQYEQLRKVSENLEKSNNCFTRTVLNENEEILAISLLFIDNNRIYNLLSATTDKGRKLNANYFLYDELIKEFCNGTHILDFEGSSIPSIEYFYKKFGAQLEPYYCLQWNNLKWPLKLLKK